MKNVLLIWAPFDIPYNNFLPLGYGYISSNISKEYNVIIKNFILDTYSDSILEQTLNDTNPIAVGLSLWEINYKNVRNITKQIKRINKEIIVILGGPSASTRDHSALDDIDADFAIKGEGEKHFEQLLDSITSGNINDHQTLKRIPGITYLNRQENSFVSNPIKTLEITNLNHPDYDKIRLEEYLSQGYAYGYFSKKLRSCSVVTTRGCPYQCEFCSARIISGTAIRKRSLQSILCEIDYLYHHYSVRGINIIDDNFTFDRNYVLEFCKAMISIKHKMPGLYLSTPNGVRLDTLDDEMLVHMKNAGWESITIAPESGSKKTLERMNKKIELSRVANVALMIKKHRLLLFAFFIIGYPGETIDDIKATVNFACKLPFDQITFSPFAPLPGSPIYKKMLESGEINKAYVSSNYFDITYAPRGISLAKMRNLFQMALIRAVLLSPRRLSFLLRSYSLRRIFQYAKKYLGI